MHLVLCPGILSSLFTRSHLQYLQSLGCFGLSQPWFLRTVGPNPGSGYIKQVFTEHVFEGVCERGSHDGRI